MSQADAILTGAAQELCLLRLPVAELSPGVVAPPLDRACPSHRLLRDWDDPLAPRGGYRVPSAKLRSADETGPCIEWSARGDDERAFVAGQFAWRDYTAICQVRPMQREAGAYADSWSATEAQAGLVLRIETSRHYYAFVIVGCRRLALFRREDDQWTELAGQDFDCHDRLLTLEVTAAGNRLWAECPEAGICLDARDDRFSQGRVGFRARGRCRLYALQVRITPRQKQVNDRSQREAVEHLAHASCALPDEHPMGEIALPPHGRLVACADFAREGRHDLLFQTVEGLEARTWDGATLWRSPERPVAWKLGALRGGARTLYALVGERQARAGVSVRGGPSDERVADELVALDGATGTLRRRSTLPDEAALDQLQRFDLSAEAGPLGGGEGVVLRQWRRDMQGGGSALWAFGPDGVPLWHRQVDPPYGHHDAVRIADVNGDGAFEVLAGGTLLSNSGEVLWLHDAAQEMRDMRFARHYDSVMLPRRDDSPHSPPAVFLLGGSAGVYVVDPLTGRTLACDRVGHAQWGAVCRVRDDVPGEQVMVGTRWGNFGILSLFSAAGHRLWHIQPDYHLQGACPIQWIPGALQHIWVNTTRDAMGLYDGTGRLVKPLEKLRVLFEPPGGLHCFPVRPRPDGPDLLGVRQAGRILLFGAS